MTTPTNFDTTPEMLEATAINCHTVASNVTVQLGGLRSSVAALEGIFLGTTSDVYVAVMSEYDRASVKLVEALNLIGNGLRSNENNYTHSNTVNQTMVQNYLGAMPKIALS